MHPDITGVSNNEVPTKEQIGRYVYKHSSRYASKDYITQINTFGKGHEGKLETHFAEIFKECEDKEKSKSRKGRKGKGKRTIFQRAQGQFIRVVVRSDGSMECNEENFRRWGSCFHSRLFGLLCLGPEKGLPIKLENLAMGKLSEGTDKIVNNIRNSMSKHLGNYTPNGVNPPSNDPMEKLAPEYAKDISQMAHLNRDTA